MTTKELERFVANANAEGLASTAASLSESERKSLSKAACLLWEAMENYRWSRGVDDESMVTTANRVLSYVDTKDVREWEQSYVAGLGVLAFGPLSQAKKIDPHFLGDWQDSRSTCLAKILADRKPTWINEWISHHFEAEYPRLEWRTLWGLVKGGACTKPTNEAYCSFLAWKIHNDCRNPDGKPIPLADYIAGEPMLLDDLWRFFEVETLAFIHEEPWVPAFVELSGRGLLDRDRLLDATLSGLTTGLKQYTLSGFAKLHDQLAPTPVEMASRQPTYCDLLSVPLPHTVNFAVKMLRKLEQSKCLDEEAFLTSASAAFDGSTKGPAKSMVSLLKKIVKRRPELAPHIAKTLLNALRHPAADVQAAAVKLFAELADRADPQTVQDLADQLDELPAAIRPQAEQLVQQAGGEIDRTATESESAELNARMLACRGRAGAIPARWRALAGVDEALTAIDRTEWAAPLDFDMMQTPILASLETIVPIETNEELIDAVAHAIEAVESASEVERIVDGISRLCDQKPDDFDRRVAPLVKRIEKVKDSESRGIGSYHAGMPALARLVGAWLAKNTDLAKPRWNYKSGTDVTDFVARRLNDVAERVMRDEAAALLAMPTHKGGWIDPVVLVMRWRQLEDSGRRPGKADLVQTLLRMAPDNRGAALAEAEPLNDPRANVMRWTLGGDQGPTKDDRKDADLWLAAGRARSPRGRLEDLTALGGQSSGPDGVAPAAYSMRATLREHQDSFKKTHRHPRLKINIEPETTGKKEENSCQPVTLMHLCGSAWLPFTMASPWVYEWLSQTWPSNLDAFFAAGADRVVHRLDSNSSVYEPNHAYLPPLFDVDRPWTDMAYLLSVVAIASRDQDASGLAVDALVEAIADGRVHPEPLGRTLAKLTTPYWLKLNRLCERLAEIARITPLHAWTIRGAVEQLLLAYDELPRDAHYLLALLRELHAQLGLPAAPPVVEKLQPIKGSSKTARLAGAVATFAPHMPTIAWEEARILLLETRLARAERWAECDSRLAKAT